MSASGLAAPAFTLRTLPLTFQTAPSVARVCLLEKDGGLTLNTDLTVQASYDGSTWGTAATLVNEGTVIPGGPWSELAGNVGSIGGTPGTSLYLKITADGVGSPLLRGYAVQTDAFVS